MYKIAKSKEIDDQERDEQERDEGQEGEAETKGGFMRRVNSHSPGVCRAARESRGGVVLSFAHYSACHLLIPLLNCIFLGVAQRRGFLDRRWARGPLPQPSALKSPWHSHMCCMTWASKPQRLLELARGFSLSSRVALKRFFF